MILWAWLIALICFGIILMIDYYRKRIKHLKYEIDLHKEALLWAVGTGKLPRTCPGHFMSLLIEAKDKADALNKFDERNWAER